jgi:hypothetical protein
VPNVFHREAKVVKVALDPGKLVVARLEDVGQKVVVGAIESRK